LLGSLKVLNTAVINATTALSNARIARDKILYGNETGIHDVAQAVKQYVLSLFTPTSAQYRQVSGIRFTVGE
jgi:ADP-heptose:LPS heptosyltransferase